MRKPIGTYHKLKTYASGKRVRLTITPGGRILEERPVGSRSKRTRTGRRLARIRRRIRQ